MTAPAVAGIGCDTPGCGEIFPWQGSFAATWRAAVDAGFRTAADRTRRGPACVEAGWPECNPATGTAPRPALYKAWSDGDEAKLTAWCDKTYGQLRTAIGELDADAEGHLAAFTAAHDADGAGENADDPEPETAGTGAQ